MRKNNAVKATNKYFTDCQEVLNFYLVPRKYKESI